MFSSYYFREAMTFTVVATFIDNSCGIVFGLRILCSGDIKPLAGRQGVDFLRHFALPILKLEFIVGDVILDQARRLSNQRPDFVLQFFQSSGNLRFLSFSASSISFCSRVSKATISAASTLVSTSRCCGANTCERVAVRLGKRETVRIVIQIS